MFWSIADDLTWKGRRCRNFAGSLSAHQTMMPSKLFLTCSVLVQLNCRLRITPSEGRLGSMSHYSIITYASILASHVILCSFFFLILKNYSYVVSAFHVNDCA